MYKDLDKKKVAERERQRRYRASKSVTPIVTPTESVTPSPFPPVIPVTPVMKTKGDAEVVVRSLPRSIGLGGDSKSDMMRKFLGGK